MPASTLLEASRAPTAYLDALTTGADPQEGLRRGLALLPALVPGCDHASTATPRVHGLQVRAATDDAARCADDLQHELGEGPVLQALRTGHSVIAHDLRTETRWPRWQVRVVAELGLGCVLSGLLLSDRRALGTLTLCASRPGGLSDVDIALLHALAEPLTATLLATVRAR